MFGIQTDYELHCKRFGANQTTELTGPIFLSLSPSNTAPFKEMSQRWQAVGNTVPELTSHRFEPQTSRSRDERVTARPTGRYLWSSLKYSRMLTNVEPVSW